MHLIVNFKSYRKGRQALALARLIQKHNKKAIVCVQHPDINLISKKTKLFVFSQHLAGKFSAKKVKELGAKGTLLNHSLHKLTLNQIKAQLEECKRLRLKPIICISSLKQLRTIKKLKPWAIAFEDPNLISTGKSITTYRSNDIKKFAKLLKGSGILAFCGAGISNMKDIKEAKKLGCKGVLISSALAKGNLKNANRLL